jgi:acyl carrier protein
MTVESIEARVTDLLARMLGHPPERLTPDTDLVQDLGISSVDFLGLVAALEDEFEILFPADGSLISSVRTVADLVALVEEFAEE